jgi:glycosyltransferase involved in cell wall biosynthesis
VKRVRILHWYPNYFGGGAVASAVCGLASAQLALGAEVAIAAAAASGPPLYESMEGRTQVTTIAWKPKWTVRSRRFLMRGIPAGAVERLRGFGPDVVHVHGEFNPDNLWVPRLFKAPIVLSPQGVFFPEALGKASKIAKAAYILLATRFLYRRIAAFHACSPFEGQYIARYFPEKSVYDAPMASRSYLRRPELGKPEAAKLGGAIAFIFVGRLAVHHKGLDILLDAFAEGVRRLNEPNVVLTLVGPDFRGGESSLHSRAQELGISDRVFFAGALSGNEVTTALEQSDIYIQISRYDGFGLSMLEALLAAKPAILSRSSGVASYPEVANLPHVRVVSANIEESAEAIAEFARRVHEVKKTALQYQAVVHDFFSWERIARLHLQKYETLERGGN